MSLIPTLMAAFFLVLVALGLLAIGWLITGRSKIKAGACGRNPHEQKNADCGTENVSCGLCKAEKKDESVR